MSTRWKKAFYLWGVAMAVVLTLMAAPAVAAVIQPGTGDDPDPRAEAEGSNRGPSERVMS